MNILKSLNAICCLVFLLGNANSIWAYQVDTHDFLSRQAVSLHNNCLPEKNFSRIISSENAQLLSAANAGEDADFVKAMPRVLNWHFYNSEKEDIQQFGIINRSMSGLLDDIDLKLEASESFDPVAAGGALHFIEDVTVPSHIVPVFHGPMPPFVFGGPTGQYWPGLILDKVDMWEINKKRLEASINELAKNNAWCELLFTFETLEPVLEMDEAKELDSRLMQFITAAEKNTLVALNEPIKDCDRKWSAFWDYDYGNDYFMGYRGDWDVNFSLEFGEEGVLSDGCELTHSKYSEFVFRRNEQAIIFGASFLAYYTGLFK